jgi:hypothetical protein
LTWTGTEFRKILPEYFSFLTRRSERQSLLFRIYFTFFSLSSGATVMLSRMGASFTIPGIPAGFRKPPAQQFNYTLK